MPKSETRWNRTFRGSNKPLSAGAIWQVVRARTFPRKSDYAEFPKNWRKDLLAGVTVGVVALPLALAFGVSSGVGAAAGIITAIVAGFVAALFGGSNFQVSGPTGAMTVVLVPIVAQYGVAAVPMVAVLGGVLVLLLGLTGMGRAVSYIPWPVVEGFTVGIATIIALQQVPFMLNIEKPDGVNTALVALDSVREADWSLAWSGAWPTLVLTFGTIGLMVLLTHIRRQLPSSLIAVAVVTLLAVWLDIPAATIGNIPNALPHFVLPNFDPGLVQALFTSAVAVAFLAAVESLLSARVADGMVDGQRSHPDRELVGQGLANIASGFTGGMPATGAIARTAVSVRAGTRTRVSAMFHSIVLLLVVAFAGGLVSHIPLAALAGVLIVTAYRMVDRFVVFAIMRTTRSDAFVFLLTAGSTIVFDLVVAVEIGIAVAALLTLRSFARSSSARRQQVHNAGEYVERDVEEQMLQQHIAMYRLDGAVFFGVAQRFLDQLTHIADVRVVILRLNGVRIMDASGAVAVKDVIVDLQRRGIQVILSGVRPHHAELLRTVKGETANSKAHHCATVDEALELAQRLVREKSSNLTNPANPSESEPDALS